MSQLFINRAVNFIKKNKYSNAINELYNNLKTVSKLFDNQVANSYSLTVEQLSWSILTLIDKLKTTTLDGRNEINTLTYNVQYIVCVANDDSKNKLFTLYLLLFKMEARLRHVYHSRVVHVGMDFEFVKNNISLMQFNFETLHSKKYNTNSIIWLVGPTYLTGEQIDHLITDLFINQDIYKILHGSDSLDLPYIYFTLLKKKEYIQLFTKKLIDTRYMCEYIKINVVGPGCNIYDALKYFGTITHQKYIQLQQIQESMGLIYTIGWDVRKLTKASVEYALYDVIFLQQFLFDMYYRIKTDDPDHITTYKYINHFLRFVFMERKEVTNVIADIKPIIDKFNNTHVNKKLFSTYYDELTEKPIILVEIGVDITFILEIGYVRKIIDPLLKYTVYSALTDQLSMDKLYSLLNDADYPHIIYVLQELYRFIKFS